MECKVKRSQLLFAQRNEISEHHTYTWLAKRIQDDRNRDVLKRIAKEELGHYKVFRRLTQTDVKPRKLRVFWYQFISRFLGLSFGLRLMERGEEITQRLYCELKEELPELADLFLDEQRHEAEVLGLIKEEHMEYAGSIVLGLNDALMELTGALAGLTFALHNGKVVAMAGFITQQKAGVTALTSPAVKEEMREYRVELKTRRDIFIKGLEELGLSVAVSPTTPYLWIKVPEVYDDEKFVLDVLIDKAHVALMPGSYFGDNGRGYMRATIFLEKSDIEETLERIRKIKTW